MNRDNLRPTRSAGNSAHSAPTDALLETAEAMTVHRASSSIVDAEIDDAPDGDLFFEEPKSIAQLEKMGATLEQCMPLKRGKALTGVFMGRGPTRPTRDVPKGVETWSVRRGNMLLHIHTTHALDAFFAPTDEKMRATAPRVGDTVYLHRGLNDSETRGSTEEQPRTVSNFLCAIVQRADAK